VRDAIIIGLFLAGFIIWLFLRDWGTAVMDGSRRSRDDLVTFIAMKILGESFQHDDFRRAGCRGPDGH